MNRLIKFRAWDRHNKRMFIVDELINLWSQYPDDSPLKRDPDVRAVQQQYLGKDLQLIVGRECDLMQFTNLYDKSGKEIYEGDIINFYEDSGEDWRSYTGKIIFESGCFWFSARGRKECLWFHHNAEDQEVVGNIYEHPELIGVNVK